MHTYSSTGTTLLKISAILWVIWGLVHAFAGGVVITSDASAAVAAIADAVNPALIDASSHPAIGAVINQHGWNLLWGGIVTIIGGVYIWRKSTAAIFITAMVGGLLDIGYFVFLDLGGHVHFMPGTVMTLFSASAIILSILAYYRMRT